MHTYPPVEDGGEDEGQGDARHGPDNGHEVVDL